MQMNKPKVEAGNIHITFPNEGSKNDFVERQNEIIRYLKEKLHNNMFQFILKVDEQIAKKFTYTPQEKYEHLVAINPALAILRRTFDLDI